MIHSVNWKSLIDSHGNKVLFYLDMDKYSIEQRVEMDRENPLVRILRDDPAKFLRAVDQATNGNAPNIIGICRLVVLVQMMLYDLLGGPEQDNKPKALRRHWYAYFKQFSQMLAALLDKVDIDASGKKVMNDIQWSGRLSQVYAGFVDSNECTYKDLWVEDASRMRNIFGFENQLIDGLNIFMAVEKDSLFDDFVAASGALGCIAVTSGKGKNSKASTERILRQLGWGDYWGEDRFKGAKNLVLHLSDHDYDGQAVIGPTFGDQMRRYIDITGEARVGVRPEHVIDVTPDPWEASYQVKMNNAAYREWADQHALVMATCSSCGHEAFSIGVSPVNYNPKLYQGNEFITTANDPCPRCGSLMQVTISDYERPHGFEVEALQSADYYAAMVDQLLSLVDWYTIIDGLRDISTRNVSGMNISFRMENEFAGNVEKYIKISNAIDILRNAQDDLVTEIRTNLERKANELISARHNELWGLGDDPDIQDFVDHVLDSARSGSGYVWRPFPVYDREDLVAQWIREDTEFVESIEVLDIENFDMVVDDVIAALE